VTPPDGRSRRARAAPRRREERREVEGGGATVRARRVWIGMREWRTKPRADGGLRHGIDLEGEEREAFTCHYKSR
jgi:hypothetical protein